MHSEDPGLRQKNYFLMRNLWHRFCVLCASIIRQYINLQYEEAFDSAAWPDVAKL